MPAAQGSDAHYQLDFVEIEVELALLQGDLERVWELVLTGLRHLAGTRVEYLTGSLLLLGIRALADAAGRARVRDDDDQLRTAIRRAETLAAVGRSMSR